MQFIVSQKGRQLRILIGALLTLFALMNWGELTQFYIAALGLEMILAGTLDFTLLAPFFNLPMSGKKIRQSLNR